MKPVPVEDLWLEGADTPPSLASRATAVAVVLGCVFAVFFLIGHATAGGGGQAEQPAGAVIGAGEATVPGGLGFVAALGTLEAPRPAPRPAASRPKAAGGEQTGEATARVAEPQALRPVSAAPAPEPAPAPKPAPAAKPAPTSSSGGGGHHSSETGGGSFDSSG